MPSLHLDDWIFYFYFFLFFINHYAPDSQANWRNMSFITGNLIPSHSCIGVTRVKPQLGFKPGGPQHADNIPTELTIHV